MMDQFEGANLMKLYCEATKQAIAVELVCLAFYLVVLPLTSLDLAIYGLF